MKMRHPSEYKTVPYGSMRIMEVDAGTTIKDERSGEEIVVDDSTFAVKGSVIWCTPKTIELIKAKIPENVR